MNGSNLRTDKTPSISIEQRIESSRTGILSANTIVRVSIAHINKSLTNLQTNFSSYSYSITVKMIHLI